MCERRNIRGANIGLSLSGSFTKKLRGSTDTGWLLSYSGSTPEEEQAQLKCQSLTTHLAHTYANLTRGEQYVSEISAVLSSKNREELQSGRSQLAASFHALEPSANKAKDRSSWQPPSLRFTVADARSWSSAVAAGR